MADQKISLLNSATLPLAGTEEYAIVQSGETKKISQSNIKLNTSIENLTTTGVYDVDYSAGDNWDLTLTGNTTITESNIPAVGLVKTITIHVIGVFALTLPVAWVVVGGGTYDGVNGSQLVVQSWNNGNYYVVINGKV